MGLLVKNLKSQHQLNHLFKSDLLYDIIILKNQVIPRTESLAQKKLDQLPSPFQDNLQISNSNTLSINEIVSEDSTKKIDLADI